MEFKIKLEDVERAATGQWGYILARLASQELGDALEKPKKHHPCPVHGGNDGFRLFGDYEQKGGGICNTCGPKAGGISLIMWANNWTFVETLNAVAGVIGVTEETELQPNPHEQKRSKTPDPEESEKVRERLRKMWNECVQVSDKDAEPLRLYMLRRRLEYRNLPKSIRFHPSLSYFDDEGKKVGEFPAMVCSIFDREGKPITLLRTYLTADGLRPKGLRPKKVMPVPPDAALMGGSVWLSEKCVSTPVVAVTEGIETGIAVQLATGIPVFAACSAGGMKAWEPLPGVRRVLVYADKDREVQTAGRMIEPGQDAAKHLVSAMWKRNIQASAIVPGMDIPKGRKSLDWADIFASYGKSGFVDVDKVMKEVNRE